MFTPKLKSASVTVAMFELELADVLAHPFDERPAADLAKRHVTAEARRLIGAHAARPAKDRGRVGAPAAESASRGDLLMEP